MKQVKRTRRNRNYSQYHKEVLRIAHHVSKRFGVEVGDLLAEGYIAFRYAQKHFDPEKGFKFSTYLWSTVDGRLTNYARRLVSGREFEEVSELNEPNYEATQESSSIIKEVIKGLPADAKEVVKIVLDTPADLVHMLAGRSTSTLNKRTLEQYLHKNRSWGLRRAREALTMLTKTLSCTF